MNISRPSAPPLTAIPQPPIHHRHTRSIDSSPAPENQIKDRITDSEDKKTDDKQKHIPGAPSNPETSIYSATIYGENSAPPPNKNFTLEERKNHIDSYAHRVKNQIKNVETGSENERNVKFQNVRQFLEPSGYFSGGLLAAGYDPHEKITATFTSYVGKGKPETLNNTFQRTYYAWEIAAGALAHDEVQRGGPINFNFMEIPEKDKSLVADLTSVGKKLQDHWENDFTSPIKSGFSLLEKLGFPGASIGSQLLGDSGVTKEIALRSGKADAYLVRGTLQNFRNNQDSFESLSPEGKEAIIRTLDKNGQVIIPNIYGYPLSGHAFIPYTPYDGDYKSRPTQGLMIDLKNGSLREIHGDKEFSTWAKDNRDNLLQSFNARDKQGGKDAHWPMTGEVLDNLISGANAHYPGYYSKTSDQSIPVSQTFNYTSLRGSDYNLKYGNLNDGIAEEYQAVNTKNATWADQTEVFGSSQQTWKAAKEFWGNTFAYIPGLGNQGNIVFGTHDGIYGMTASDRVGGNSAAVISALQLAHDAAPFAAEASLGEVPLSFNAPKAEDYSWRYNSQNDNFELVRASEAESGTNEVETSRQGRTETSSEAGDIRPKQPETINPLRPSQSGHISQHAVPDGEKVIEYAVRNAKGIYQVKDPLTGADSWFIRYTDAQGIPGVYEIKSDFKLSNGYVQIIDPKTRTPVMTVHSSGHGEWAPASGKGGIKWPWERTPSPTPSDDPKSPTTFANNFLDLDGKKLPSADRIDEFLKVREGTQYDFAGSNYEENGVIKTKFQVDWSIEDNNFAVAPGEKAQLTEHSSNKYSPNFVLDLNRNTYTVVTTENGLPVSKPLNAGAGSGSAEGIRQGRLQQFEQLIPDADLRASISEVAHQGSLAPAVMDLSPGSMLQDGYYFAADDTQFYIVQAPEKDLTKVQITSKGHLSYPDKDIRNIPGVEVTIRRTFTIRKGNELGSPYPIDKDAPTNIEVSVAPRNEVTR